MDKDLTDELVYVATPYSHPDPRIMEARFKFACVLTNHLMQTEDKIFFSPIAHTHPIAVAGELPRGWGYWQKYDSRMLRACDRLYVAKINGWEKSVGVQSEIEIAKALLRPIDYITIDSNYLDKLKIELNCDECNGLGSTINHTTQALEETCPNCRGLGTIDYRKALLEC